MRLRLRFGLAISILAASPLARAEPLLYDVRVEEASRRTATGDTVPYTLFVPVARASLSAPPWPAVILTHGFARDRRFHAENARYMAERGIIVLTPNLSGGLGTRRGRIRNVESIRDHVRWLIDRSATPGDALSGLVDPVRMGLAGHSAGGAVSFEAALLLSKSPTPVEALLLLDGVPWSRTTARASALPPMDFASLRSEPSACNAFASVLGLQDRLRFPTDDARILGGTHCDPENPTDALCELACGGASAFARSRYQRLMYLFFHDALRSLLPESQSYREALEDLVSSGAVEVDSFGPPVSVRLFVNGSHGNGIVDTEGRTRVTVDSFARQAGHPADWYFGWFVSGRVLWVTPIGWSATPAPLFRLEPVPLDDLVLVDTDLPGGTSVTFFLVLADVAGGLSHVLAYDIVTARTPAAR
jgi:acetyl esterase/lipase